MTSAATSSALHSTDLLDGAIWNESNQASAQSRYAHTPAFSAETLNEALDTRPEVVLGRSFHLGDGVWAVFCSECHSHVRSYGALLLTRPILDHKSEVHGIDQGPLLP